MKRKTPFLIFMICAVVMCLFACDSEVTEIVPKGEEFEMTIGSSMDLTDLAEITGKGQVDYLIEPAGIVSLQNDKLVALKEGICTVTVYSGEIQCKINVSVISGKTVTVGIRDESYTYDGTVRTLQVLGAYPASSEVILRNNGERFYGASEPGVYELELEVVAPAGYEVKYSARTATLTIDKIYVDMSSVRFAQATYVYDGEEKQLTITGNLPAGVAVRYEDNVATDVGSYLAKAHFSVDNRHYHEIEPMKARLNIVKCDLSDKISVENPSVTFDNAEHFPVWSLPSGVTATHYVYSSATSRYIPKEEYYSAYAANRPFINCGNYRVKTVFTLDEDMERNYSVPAEKEITVIISKADLDVALSFENSTFTYDGTPKTVGLGESYDVGLVGEMPKDIEGNIVEGVTIKFYYGGALADTFSFTTTGRYSVLAKFSVPDEYLKNYNAIQDKSCTIKINKADYPSDFTFDAQELYGDLDFSTSQEYDGLKHYFALRFPSDEVKDAFTEDIAIKYYYRKNDESAVESNDEVWIKDAGNYTVGYRLSFKDATLGVNYNLSASGSFTTTISKVVFNMTDVLFDDLVVSYDGNTHTPEVTGVPEGVTTSIYNGNQTTAGTYVVEASFSAENIPYGNYSLKGRYGEVTSLSATLTINKANYKKEDIPEFYTEEIIYSSTAKLSDVPILLGGEPAQNAAWMDGDETPVCDVLYYVYKYNADTTNYNDYVSSLGLTVRPLVLEADKFSVSDQFVPIGSYPKIIYDGEAISGVSLDYNCETVVSEVGAHLLTDVSLVLDDTVNYAFDGSVYFDDLTIYSYNASLFVYEGLQLKRYVGKQTDVSVQTGTVSIANGAFNNCHIYAITLPETLESMSENALGGVKDLRELTLPYIGTQRGTGVFSGIFGSGIPDTLVKVTVTDMTELPSNAFANASCLTNIIFTRSISSVGQYAFNGCSSLTSLTFNELTYLGSSAFRGCFSLSYLSLSAMGESAQAANALSYLIGSNAGENAYSNYCLTTLDLGRCAFVNVPTEAFKGMGALSSLVLPSTLSSVAYKAFGGLYADVALNDNFTSITNGAFYGYMGRNVTIPSTVERIEQEAFREATNITELTLPSSLNYIGQRAFKNVTATLVFTGNALTRLEEYALSEYKGVGFTLPASVTSLGDGAFAGSAISTIDITSDLVLDGDGIFKNCRSLWNVSVDAEEIPYATFEGCDALSHVLLSRVVNIRGRAFYGCSSLSTLMMPDTMASIGSYAFYGCSALTAMRFEGEAPSLGSSVLPATGVGTLRVQVPEEFVMSYAELLLPYENVEVEGYAKS